jgi:hypothetical protein
MNPNDDVPNPKPTMAPSSSSSSPATISSSAWITLIVISSVGLTGTVHNLVVEYHI